MMFLKELSLLPVFRVCFGSMLKIENAHGTGARMDHIAD
jgi:hypothetical protein